MNKIVLILVASVIFFIYAALYKAWSMRHYIPRKDKSSPSQINGVPLVIYQSWQTHVLPSGMKKNIMNTIANNPEFDYYLYSDSDSRKFIKDNYDSSVVAAFDSLRPGAYKSDLWRYCILYKLGGVYFDIKMVPLVPLISLVQNHSTVFVKDFTISHATEGKSMTNMRDCVWNGLMISPPGNDIFMHCIEEIVQSCKAHHYKANPLDITGPCLLGRMIKKHRSQEYFNYMVLNLNREDNKVGVIYYHNIHYFNTEYPGYRKEQRRTQKNLHYGVLYHKKQVYQ